jgi:hypothetical protein
MLTYENDDAGWKVFRESEDLKFFYKEYLEWITNIYDPNAKDEPTPTTDTTPNPAPDRVDNSLKDLFSVCSGKNTCILGLKCARDYDKGYSVCVYESSCTKERLSRKEVDCYGYVYEKT